MNILITSSSSKVLLVKDFKYHANKRSIKVFTADLSDEVATAYFSDKYFVLPPTNDIEKYGKEMLNICKTNNISLIIPTRDGELQIMSELKEKMAKHNNVILVPNKDN